LEFIKISVLGSLIIIFSFGIIGFSEVYAGTDFGCIGFAIDNHYWKLGTHVEFDGLIPKIVPNDPFFSILGNWQAFQIPLITAGTSHIVVDCDPDNSAKAIKEDGRIVLSKTSSSGVIEYGLFVVNENDFAIMNSAVDLKAEMEIRGGFENNGFHELFANEDNCTVNNGGIYQNKGTLEVRGELRGAGRFCNGELQNLNKVLLTGSQPASAFGHGTLFFLKDASLTNTDTGTIEIQTKKKFFTQVLLSIGDPTKPCIPKCLRGGLTIQGDLDNFGKIINKGTLDIGGVIETRGKLGLPGDFVGPQGGFFNNFGTTTNEAGSDFQNHNIIKNRGNIENNCGSSFVNKGAILNHGVITGGNFIDNQGTIDNLNGGYIQKTCMPDTEPPVFTFVPPNILAECNQKSGWSGNIGMATATDNEDPSPDITND